MFYLLTVKESLENKNELNIKMIVFQSKKFYYKTNFRNNVFYSNHCFN